MRAVGGTIARETAASNPLLLFWRSKDLILQLTRRDIISKYKGSFLGITWSFITPLLMLAVYTFVFSVVFKARWNVNSTNNRVEFALVLFCGLSAYNFFSEVVLRSPGLILNNVNYVTKVVFPLEILSVVAILSSGINFMTNVMILLIGLLLLMGVIHWTVVFFPLVVLPIVLLALGLSWLLASIGVFFRDIGQFMAVFIQALVFLSPIFYPVTAIPKGFRFLIYLNPISYVAEDMRQIMVWGHMPNWQWLCVGTLVGTCVAALGYMWFQRTKGGFADVL
ncbi:MAG: ABC transporter permease [Alicyclobacillus sp.]|nr:ABC transporter permease [Alicyclobacillus sp.]